MGPCAPGALVVNGTATALEAGCGQRAAAPPTEGLIQFGSDNNLYFYKGGAWNKISTTAAAPPA